MTYTTVEKAKIASTFDLDRNKFIVSLSDAETQVIKQKAKKAGIHVNEYIRNAALGFPMG